MAKFLPSEAGAIWFAVKSVYSMKELLSNNTEQKALVSQLHARQAREKKTHAPVLTRARVKTLRGLDGKILVKP
jgi:hypothetical protein